MGLHAPLPAILPPRALAHGDSRHQRFRELGGVHECPGVYTSDGRLWTRGPYLQDAQSRNSSVQFWRAGPRIFDLDDDIPALPLNSCVCNGRSSFVGTLIGYVVPSYALAINDFGNLMGEAFRRSLFGKAHERLDARTWARLLALYLSETVECPRGHLYHASQDECPYCRGERTLLALLADC